MDSKLAHYEAFVNEKLRGDLQQVENRLAKILEELNEYQSLKSLIQKLEDKKIPSDHMRVYTDLGCNFRVQAHIVDPCTMYVNLGLDVYVEMPLAQASKYVTARINSLTSTVESLKKAEYQIKSHIRVVLEGLRQMQSISAEPPEAITPSLRW
ncbi:protein UXT-like [Paramacrobiotus metropolitanus]|uniref:protein UXT-like n=1 Tax=Paramacrobiotus metropolitanus TaxID=2943436 RepID=UPI0024460840|nr:protein UXT-like [Paramacrobiotus metropolitanus]